MTLIWRLQQLLVHCDIYQSTLNKTVQTKDLWQTLYPQKKRTLKQETFFERPHIIWNLTLIFSILLRSFSDSNIAQAFSNNWRARSRCPCLPNSLPFWIKRLYRNLSSSLSSEWSEKQKMFINMKWWIWVRTRFCCVTLCTC